MKKSSIYFNKFLLFFLSILVFIGIFVFLGIRSMNQWQDIVVSQFNQEQLTIARSIAGRLDNYFDSKTQYLNLFTLMYFKNIYADPQEILNKSEDLNVESITLLFSSGHKQTVDSNGSHDDETLTDRETAYLSMLNINDREPYVGETYQSDKSVPRKWRVDIVTFHKETAIVWTIDILKVCQDLISNLRSGKTGYAWIINKQGYFLAHIDTAFIGENAFIAQTQKYPAISFGRINSLQKDHLLQGKEGTSWYVHGPLRHDIQNPIKKIIAYTPAYYAGPKEKDKFWSVAVSAPISEIEGLVGEAIMYQWLLMLIALTILGVTIGYISYTKWRWSYTLKEEVLRKTDELRKLHKVLLRSERLSAVGSAVAYVTHEIKNSLLVIGGFSTQLLRDLDKDEKQKKKLEIIVGESRRLEGFLRDIGQFGKDLDLQKEVIDLTVWIPENMDYFENELVNQKISLDINLEPGPIYISANSDQLKQLLINVIKNAIEAMPEGGSLRVNTHGDKYAYIEIIDTGKGIAQEDLDKTFNPFFTTKHEGSGLGLSICDKIASAHSAVISIDSEGLNKGVSVTLRFPLAAPI